MKIVEQTPAYYRVLLPNGETTTIARTPGTEAMLRSQTVGLADGGMVPLVPDPLAALQQQLPPGYVEPVPVATGVPAEQAMPPVRGGGGPGVAGSAAGALLAPPKPWEIVAPVPAMVSRAAGALGAVTGHPNAPDVGAAAQKAATFATTPIGETPAPAAAPAEKSADTGENPFAKMDGLFDPFAVAPAKPAGKGGAMPSAPSTKALADAQAQTAANQAKFQEEIAAVHRGSQPPSPPPSPSPVDPGQFHERVGAMFGAKDPRSARIFGGIALGLLAGLGEFGATIAGRQNGAAAMIQQSIAENIASQHGAQALSRQQWLDQTNYANAMVAKKIDEIAAMAKGQEAKDRAKEAAEKMKLDLALQTYGALAKQGTIPAETAAKLSDIELVRAAGRDLTNILGTFPSGWWANFDDKRLPGDDQNVKRANAAMTILNNRIETMLKTRGKLPGEEGEATRGLEALKVTLADNQDTLRTKLQAIANMTNQQRAVVMASGAGADPTGATQLTPGARPN